jgi:hypothetical protein
MQTQIKFLVGGANSVCGGFVAGDILRCSQAFAKHLVEEVKCAKYMDAQPVAAEPDAEPDAEPVKRGRKGK